MTITSGRRPSVSIVASRSSASAPPAACPTTSRSGSLPRNASNPRRTTSWSSTTRTPMVSSPRTSMSGRFPSGRHPDSHACPVAGRARDREPPTDLSRPASPRLQTEVTRMSVAGVEAAPVVRDLDNHLLPPSLDSDLRDAGSGVPDDIRERLASDGEQLRLHLLGHPQAGLGSTDLDRQAVRGVQLV